MTTPSSWLEALSWTQPSSTPQDTACSGCRSTDESGLRLAVENLSRKYTQLAEVLAHYLGEASLDRDLRVRNAEEYARFVERIIGGVETGEGDFPDCALIGRRSPGGFTSWFCTGVLVHPSVVLTAAHCQSPFAGINEVALQAVDMLNLKGAEIVPVRRVRVNPLYRQISGNDISVLILRDPATVAPVPIAKTEELVQARQTTLVGFGNNDPRSTKGFGRQRMVTVDITNLRRGPNDDLDDAEQTLGFESEREFTAGGAGFDSCNGDSGGPAFLDVQGVRKVAGLTSRGARGAVQPCGEGGIYTRIDTQRSFIDQVMRDAGIADQL